MVTELIRLVNYNPGISQKLIKLEISSCRCSQLECNEERDETEGYSALYALTLALKHVITLSTKPVFLIWIKTQKMFGLHESWFAICVVNFVWHRDVATKKNFGHDCVLLIHMDGTVTHRCYN